MLFLKSFLQALGILVLIVAVVAALDGILYLVLTFVPPQFVPLCFVGALILALLTTCMYLYNLDTKDNQ